MSQGVTSSLPDHGSWVTAAALSVGAQEQVRATFRSSLDLVSIAAVVRDGSGRLVTGLTAQDFEVVDAGIRGQ